MSIIFLSNRPGLGNQMFHHAVCIARNARGRKTKLCLGKSKQEYNLNGVFNMTYPWLAPPWYCHYIWRMVCSEKIYKILLSLHLIYHESDKFIVYDEKALLTRKPLIIGYFQNVKYIEDTAISSQLREDFACPDRIFNDDVFRRYYNRITGHNSISIHVRRGDFLKGDNNLVYGNICTDEYYKAAINHAERVCKDAIFYVFSDDKEYIRKVFTGERFVIMDDPLLDTSMEFFLMRYCRHHIISNSTFSWWAAWLDDAPDAMIVAPDKFTNTVEIGLRTDRMTIIDSCGIIRNH